MTRSRRQTPRRSACRTPDSGFAARRRTPGNSQAARSPIPRSSAERSRKKGRPQPSRRAPSGALREASRPPCPSKATVDSIRAARRGRRPRACSGGARWRSGSASAATIPSNPLTSSHASCESTAPESPGSSTTADEAAGRRVARYLRSTTRIVCSRPRARRPGSRAKRREAVRSPSRRRLTAIRYPVRSNGNHSQTG